MKSMCYIVKILILCVSVVKLANADDVESYIGIIEPRQIVHIGSPVSGIVERLPVDRGDLIKKGDVIAELNSEVERIDFELAKKRFELMKNRYERQKQLDSNSLAAREEVEKALAEMELAHLEMQRREVFLQQKYIRASVNGVILERLVREGEYVYEQVALAKIAQVNPLNVQLLLPVSQFNAVKKGSKALVEIGYPVNGTFPALVEVVDSNFDVASSTFGVRLILENINSSLPSGMKCAVKFPHDPQIGAR